MANGANKTGGKGTRTADKKAIAGMSVLNRRELYVLIAGIVLLVGIVIVGISLSGRKGAELEGVPAEEGAGPSAAEAQQELKDTGFTSFVPQDAVETTPEEQVQVVTDPTRDQSLGAYHVVASWRGYDPNELVVVQGNIVRITFVSQGGQYDLSIPAMGVYLTGPSGIEQHTSFRVPQSGTFKIECRDYCAAGGMEGLLIVKPK